MPDELKPCPQKGMTAEEIDAFNWAINQQYQSVAARKASALANYIRRTEPENKALTLEQLKRMGGEPVWIENLKNPQTSHWWVVEELCHGTWDNYGKTWIAYARQPEAGEKE